MSLDERIRQLSETIIEEVRGPIEASLHRLLGDVMTLAAADRDQAVEAATAESKAACESAMAALREEHERNRVDADAMREQFARELDASQAALREQLERDRHAELAALREQLERDRDAAVADALRQAKEEREESLAALREQLERERDAALAAAGSDIEREREAALTALRTQLTEENEAALAGLRDELGRVHESALDAALRSASDEAARARASELEGLQVMAAAERDAALQAAREELDRRHAEAASEAQAELERVRREHEAVQAELSQAREVVRSAEQRLQDHDKAAAEARAALEAAEQAVHATDRQQDLACSDRTLAAFRLLDASRSLTEVLTVLLHQSAAEIGRAALFTVTGSRLHGWGARGFEGVDVTTVDAPLEEDSTFGVAVNTGLPVSTADAPLSFAGGLAESVGLPEGRAGLAVPLSVGGRVVAILYADEGRERVPVFPSNWPEIAEILSRHAAHRLELLTVSHAAAVAGRVQRTGQADGRPAERPDDGSPQADERREEESARRYARLLISEIKLYNEPAVEQGRESRDLLARLGEDIERARRLYEEKIPAAVRQRVNCFDQEVVRTLAGGDADLLGQT